jgi:hypothetical protein
MPLKAWMFVPSSCVVLFCVVMSKEWDYVSELRPPIGLLFISQVIFEYGEPRRNDIGRGTEELGERAVPVPLCPPQVPHGRTLARNRASEVRGPATNLLSHDTALSCVGRGLAIGWFPAFPSTNSTNCRKKQGRGTSRRGGLGSPRTLESQGKKI